MRKYKNTNNIWSNKRCLLLMVRLNFGEIFLMDHLYTLICWKHNIAKSRHSNKKIVWRFQFNSKVGLSRVLLESSSSFYPFSRHPFHGYSFFLAGLESAVSEGLGCTFQHGGNGAGGLSVTSKECLPTSPGASWEVVSLSQHQCLLLVLTECNNRRCVSGLLHQLNLLLIRLSQVRSPGHAGEYQHWLDNLPVQGSESLGSGRMAWILILGSGCNICGIRLESRPLV